MKRSDMLLNLTELIKSEQSWGEPQLAKAILDRIESLGMLPPYVDYTLSEEEYKVLNTVDDHFWEFEDETK